MNSHTKHVQAHLFFNADFGTYFVVKATSIPAASKFLFGGLRRVDTSSVVPIEVAHSTLAKFEDIVKSATTQEVWNMSRYHGWWPIYEVAEDFSITTLAKTDVEWLPYPDEAFLAIHGEESLETGHYRQFTGIFVEGELLVQKDSRNIWFFKRIGDEFLYHRKAGPAVMLGTDVRYHYVDGVYMGTTRYLEMEGK